MRRRALAATSKISSLGQAPSVSRVWSNFESRSPSLLINNEQVKKGLLNKLDPKQGPASYPTYEERLQYHSPLEIDETFAVSYKILEEEASRSFASAQRLQEIKNKLVKEGKDLGHLQTRIDEKLIQAEIKNPEVLYNVEFSDPDSIDMSQPVYRHLMKQKWEDHDLMLLMQRLEQLHVIPDTMPTLDPKAEVKIKFTHNTDPLFKGWVVPGSMVPAHSVSKPPTIKVQEFDRIEGDNNLYTVLIVNPDTPNLETNSFTTKLHYGLKNVPLNNVDNLIDVPKLMKMGPKVTFQEYTPLTPEKNTSYQRACLWVFRQPQKIADDAEALQLGQEHFDIRKFAQDHGLTAVGATVWRQKFDRSVPKVREEYGLGPGRVYYKTRSDEMVNF